MKKIRINELARELEVKPGVILDMLPELGVQEKKTHSSSIDEDVAIILRERLTGSGVPSGESSNGHVHEAPAAEERGAAAVSEPPAAEPVQPAGAVLHAPLPSAKEATLCFPTARRTRNSCQRSASAICCRGCRRAGFG